MNQCNGRMLYAIQCSSRAGWYLGCIGIRFVDTCPALLVMFCASACFFLLLRMDGSAVGVGHLYNQEEESQPFGFFTVFSLNWRGGQ